MKGGGGGICLCIIFSGYGYCVLGLEPHPLLVEGARSPVVILLFCTLERSTDKHSWLSRIGISLKTQQLLFLVCITRYLVRM